MHKDKPLVCPAEHAGFLVNPIRRWFQNPEKILKNYVKEGMTVLDVGCGPGFFTVPMASMVGEHGKVIAADIQAGMLERLRARIDGQEVQARITLHLSREGELGVQEAVDFALAFYVVHEVRDKERLFRELRSILKPGAELLLVEPKFHVSKGAFEESVATATAAGFVAAKGPNRLLSRSVVLRNPVA